MVADERLGAELAEEGVHHPRQVDPDEGGQAAETAVGATMDAANSAMRWGSQQVLAARAGAGELGPVASEELVRGCFLGRDGEQVCSCSLLHQSVFNWEAVTIPPDYGWIIVLRYFFFGLNPILTRRLSLLLHRTAWPACGQQVPEAGVRQMGILVVEVGELCGHTQIGFTW